MSYYIRVRRCQVEGSRRGRSVDELARRAMVIREHRRTALTSFAPILEVGREHARVVGDITVPFCTLDVLSFICLESPAHWRGKKEQKISDLPVCSDPRRSKSRKQRHMQQRAATSGAETNQHDGSLSIRAACTQPLSPSPLSIFAPHSRRRHSTDIHSLAFL